MKWWLYTVNKFGKNPPAYVLVPHINLPAVRWVIFFSIAETEFSFKGNEQVDFFLRLGGYRYTSRCCYIGNGVFLQRLHHRMVFAQSKKCDIYHCSMIKDKIIKNVIFYNEWVILVFLWRESACKSIIRFVMHLLQNRPLFGSTGFEIFTYAAPIHIV
jgi:hypothetical protein